MFKIGDRIELIGCGRDQSDEWNGKLGTIIEDYGKTYEILFDDCEFIRTKTRNPSHWTDKHLRRIETDPLKASIRAYVEAELGGQ